ncbi:hypothetical protein [Arthrobacter sp. A2-55]|uniref:hypothetical protein n=1 Tax=Arthrobacter sp. A2-55 TaxID=2897337 RepID=UPI0021CD7C26|nr:hypothetical protein [Arthrobacter sp. A2-55]MCU6480132.1 hypothetical protein [Arthrobacter sp. A2-55]
MTDPELAISHAWKLPAGTDIFTLANRLRPVVEPIRRNLEIREVAFFAAKILDQADLTGATRPASVVFDAVQAHAEHVKATLAGDHHCPLTTLKLACLDDPATGDILVMADFSHDEYGQALDDAEIGEFFPYWDEDATGESRPAGVSGAHWAARGEAWERALRGAPSAAPHGVFQIEFGSPLPGFDAITDTEAVLAAIPPMTTRVEVIMNEFLHGQEFHNPSEMIDFMASVPSHLERISNLLCPIALGDLSGGA